ncbi:hypothetical protein [Gemmatimonas sp.]|uniref:hypothetical protein n=1 Tax=Gemmatimonas sp. TaxID=1962908 RepID=UPI003DA217E6
MMLALVARPSAMACCSCVTLASVTSSGFALCAAADVVVAESSRAKISWRMGALVAGEWD